MVGVWVFVVECAERSQPQSWRGGPYFSSQLCWSESDSFIVGRGGGGGCWSSVVSSLPVWAQGLKKCGAYYEGYVEDLEGTLELHRQHSHNMGYLWSHRKQPTPGETDKENEFKNIVCRSPIISYRICLCNILASLCKQFVVWVENFSIVNN